VPRDRPFTQAARYIALGPACRGTSKSAVSRTLGRRVTATLVAQLEQRLDGLEVVALFLDGVVIAGQTVIVGLGLTREGDKRPLGLRLGSTENAVVCTDLLQDLLGRGLAITERVLCVIDGGKGLRKAVQDVLGTAAVIQRCQIHKARNVQALVPKARQAHVRAALRRAYRAASADASRRQLKALGGSLEANGHVDAAASLREGLEETLTVLTLELPTRLRRFFATTNCIENLIGTVRHVTRNVKRWRDGRMIRRWVGLALGRAATRFRRIKSHGELTTLQWRCGSQRPPRPRRESRGRLSRDAFSAKGKEGSGAILRMGVAMSVFPQGRPLRAHRSTARRRAL
jgi:putative transposase